METWERTLTKEGADAGSSLASDAVLLSCRAPIGHVGRVSEPVAFNQGCKALIPERAADMRYLAYCLVAARPALEAMGNGTTFTELSATALSGLRLPWPGVRARDCKTAYLDRETAEIDAMDVDLDRLLSDLTERRLSDTDHTFKELFAGRTIPLWSVLTPLKDQNHVSEDVLSVYRDYGVIPKDSRDDNHNRTPEDLSLYQLVMPGDLVMNKMKAWQGSLGVSKYRGIVSPDYQVARPIIEVDSRYLHEVLRSPMMVPQYRAHSRGVRPSQWRLYWDDFSHLRIPLPDLGTQRRVVEDLTQGNREVTAMRSDALRLKELLAERRTNLITEVVTDRKEIV